MSSDDDPEVAPSASVEVRETTMLFRLAPVASDLTQRTRQIAIVAADSEEEARDVAAKHDVFGRSWRDSAYASCEFQLTTEHHVFGDVVFRSEPVAFTSGKRAAGLKRP